ncbi:MAG: class I SAM-dependent methyltransferase [Patescibacteria group bacterium]
MNLKDIKNQFPVWHGWYGRFLPKDKSAIILDAGCGRGGMVNWLQNKGYSNTEGIDINREKIDEGTGLGVKNIHHGDALSFLKNKNDYYDRVFLVDVLDYLTKEETLNLLEEIFKSLKKDGIVVIRGVNAESPVGRLRNAHFGERVDITEQSIKTALSGIGFREPGAYPVRPVVHGMKSFIRHCLWRIIEIGLKLYRLIETGSSAGIFTQNVIIVGRK